MKGYSLSHDRVAMDIQHKMLTEGIQSWQVEDKSTCAPLVNIEAKYPVLLDHDEME